MYQTDNIAEIFKTEYSNIVAVLCHYYKVGNIQLAEDLVSETFLKAMKTWSHNGIPDSPKAWLRKTAKNS
jgi:RNA polymerase sigma-70 factor (ECF subfamily)